MKILLISPNQVYATARLKAEALQQGLEVVQYSARNFVENKIQINEIGYDGLYVRFAYPYFAEIGELVSKFKTAGKGVVDANLNVENLDLNKLADNQELLKVAISAPESFEYKDFSKLALPMVVKAKFGFGKKQVSLCNNQEQLEKFALNYKDGEVLVQKFVPAEFEYKVITVGYKSISKVIKFKTWAGGFGIDPQDCQILDSKNCPEVCHLAEAAAKVLGKELAKTDILESAGKLYVVEVNRSPGFESFEKLSGENVAAEFVAYLKQNFTK